MRDWFFYNSIRDIMIDVCDDVCGQRNVINLNEEEKIWDKDDLHLLLPLTILPNWSSRSSHSILKSLREHLPNSTHSHSILPNDGDPPSVISLRNGNVDD